MFDINNIYTDHSGKRFLCDCLCDSSKTAEYFCAYLLGYARKCSFMADLYTKGNRLILDTPVETKTVELIEKLNKAIEAIINQRRL